jgi:diguanylate cyclase (GGDEF)-like protein
LQEELRRVVRLSGHHGNGQNGSRCHQLDPERAHELSQKFQRIQADPAHATVLILLDVDHFKRVNDQFGHLGGDEVLRWVASSITRQLRPGHLVGRWGGEEFVIVAPQTSLAGGTQLAERVRQCISAAAHPTVGSLTISAGIATWAGGMPVEQALRLADQALYQAKAGGRNRVVAAAARLSPNSDHRQIVA